VVTGWTPHWKFNQWKLKYLDDPKGVYGGEEHINAVVRQGLKADMPEVYRFLDNFNWELRHIEQVMAWNQDNQEPYKNAKRFLKQYPKLVESWLKN
jgi:glycine betaine/proline transport system substrate-binding protein